MARIKSRWPRSKISHRYSLRSNLYVSTKGSAPGRGQQRFGSARAQDHWPSASPRITLRGQDRSRRHGGRGQRDGTGLGRAERVRPQEINSKGKGLWWRGSHLIRMHRLHSIQSPSRARNLGSCYGREIHRVSPQTFTSNPHPAQTRPIPRSRLCFAPQSVGVLCL